MKHTTCNHHVFLELRIIMVLFIEPDLRSLINLQGKHSKKKRKEQYVDLYLTNRPTQPK